MTPGKALADLIVVPEVKSTQDALERMRLIEEHLPTLDGVAWFNKMYLKTTENVLKAIGQGLFADERFMKRLDLDFANLYFQALYDSLHQPERIPRAWAPLFDARKRRNVAPIQFAIAGMNAHINRDLPVAVVRTCRRLKLTPDVQHRRDFDKVTEILGKTQEEVKKWFSTGFVALLDEVFGRLDDVTAIWSIYKAREAGWTNSQILWEVRGLRLASGAFLQNLDRMVGFAGRGLLVPTS